MHCMGSLMQSFILILVLLPFFASSSAKSNVRPNNLTTGQSPSSRIAIENALQGSSDWWQPYINDKTSDAIAHNERLDAYAMSLEGFSTIFSTPPGEKIDFKVDYLTNIKSANLKVSLEDYYWAIADYTKAIEIDRYDGSVYNNRNTAKYFLGDKNGACKDAIKARKLGYNASELINLVCN